MSWGLVCKSMCDESIVVLIVIYASLSIILSVKTSIVYILSDAISRIKCPGMSSLKCCQILCLFVFTSMNRITKTISLFPSQKTGQCLQQLHINAAQKLVNSRWISLVVERSTQFRQQRGNFTEAFYKPQTCIKQKPSTTTNKHARANLQKDQHLWKNRHFIQ